MSEWMNEWMDGWMNEWMDGWTNEWMDGWMNKWMDGWDGWMNKWMDGEWMNKWMSGWMINYFIELVSNSTAASSWSGGRGGGGRGAWGIMESLRPLVPDGCDESTKLRIYSNSYLYYNFGPRDFRTHTTRLTPIPEKEWDCVQLSEFQSSLKCIEWEGTLVPSIHMTHLLCYSSTTIHQNLHQYIT